MRSAQGVGFDQRCARRNRQSVAAAAEALNARRAFRRSANVQVSAQPAPNTLNETGLPVVVRYAVLFFLRLRMRPLSMRVARNAAKRVQNPDKCSSAFLNTCATYLYCPRPRQNLCYQSGQHRITNSTNQQRRLTVLEHRQTPDHHHPNTQDDHGYLRVYNTTVSRRETRFAIERRTRTKVRLPAPHRKRWCHVGGRGVCTLYSSPWALVGAGRICHRIQSGR